MLLQWSMDRSEVGPDKLRIRPKTTDDAAVAHRYHHHTLAALSTAIPCGSAMLSTEHKARRGRILPLSVAQYKTKQSDGWTVTSTGTTAAVWWRRHHQLD